MTPMMTCERMESLLGERFERTLAAVDREAMDAHLATCRPCRELFGDIEQIIAESRDLPTLVPSRDLWSGIASQLGAQEEAAASTPAVDVRRIDSSRATPRWMPRVISMRSFAAAAVLLVAVTAGVTWQLARAGSDAGPVATTTTAPTTPGFDSTALLPVANTGADVDAIYEREIAALRIIVDERFTDLDSATVAELKANIAIIDKAIADSREALVRDPRSRLLSGQLDRALEHKLDMLRRVALL